MITIQGKGVSAGVGVGPLYFYRRATAEIKRYTVRIPTPSGTASKGAPDRRNRAAGRAGRAGPQGGR